MLALRYALCHIGDLLIASTSRADSFFRSIPDSLARATDLGTVRAEKEGSVRVLMHQIVTNEASSARRELTDWYTWHSGPKAGSAHGALRIVDGSTPEGCLGLCTFASPMATRCPPR